MRIRLPALHPTQAVVRKDIARFKVLACGRRWGKTLLGSELCLAVALQGGRAWWVAPTYKMGDPGWRALAGIAAQIPGAIIKRGDRRILIGQSGVVEVRSADAWQRLKGEKLHFVVMDECAQIQEAAWSESIRPTLTDYKGAAMFISTPKGRGNWFYRLFLQGESKDYPDYSAHQFPTSTNPYIDKGEIELARQELPDLTFEQEYLAIFLIDEGTVFRNVQAACIAPQDQTPAMHKGHKLVGGIDWASVSDFTAISIGCLDCHREVFRDRFNKIDYLLQSGRILGIWDTWKVDTHFAGFLAEQNSMGLPIIQALQDRGLPVVGFTTTYASKGQIIRNLSLIVERVAWQFQDDPTWTTEMLVYEQKVSPVTGNRAYNAPEGFHDDTVIARALMVKADDYLLSGELFL